MTQADLLRMALSLVLIVLVILAGAWLTRRAGWLRNDMQETIKVLGSQKLGARASITLVEVGETRLLLGVTTQNIALLHTLSDTETSPAPRPVTQSNSFRASLKQVLVKRGA